MRINRRDVLSVTAALVIGLVLYALHAYAGPQHGLPPTVFLGTLALGTLALGLTRRWPVLGLSLGAVAMVADIAVGLSTAAVVIFTQILYDASIYGPRRLPPVLVWLGVMISVVLTVVGLVITGKLNGALPGIIFAIVVVGSTLTGMHVRHHREAAAAERLRAEQVARLAELDHRQAVLAERTRMARELHDLVANHLSVIAIHSAGALALPSEEPGTIADTRTAMAVIRENAVLGLAEMRQMITLLREGEEPDPDDAAPGLDGVAQLVERARRAGLSVASHIEGEPRRLPASVELAAYRIVQESLTNALKHGKSEVQLTLEYAANHLAVTIVNPLRTAVPPAPTADGGSGLVGMAERASLLGGQFSAEPRDGAWRVQVELPLDQPTPVREVAS